MARKELTVEPRQVTGKKVAQLRRAGILPANIYGHGLDSVSVQVATDDLEKTLRAATANEVIDVQVTGESAARPIVVHKVQRHPLTSGALHADFYQVSLRERMRGGVPLIVTGVSDAVATYNGVLMTSIETLQIEALPLDFPTHIEVDISGLDELEAAIHVRDLIVPGNVTVLNEPDVVVVKVASPRVMEEEEPVAAAEGEAAAATGEAGEAPQAEAEAEPESDSKDEA
ncbi:MAG: 50S ribosomal protein L25 [Dehalococcoidia bacterium]|nr:50S ribosomal protein L25 [Dehalococcoidia bacterium]